MSNSANLSSSLFLTLVVDEVTPHFPMCTLLKENQFWLGRNCRMLSMQAMEKSATLGVGGVS